MTLLKVNNRPAYRSFDGLVNDLFGNLDNLANRNNSNSSLPPVNIAETDNHYQLDIAAPGRNKENFKVKVEGTQLTISYELSEEKTENTSKHIRKEFSSNAFNRSFTLNDKVNSENIQARYENGILTVLIPKKEEAKPVTKEITIG